MSCFQEVIIEGQDKVFKDVIEPLESVSVNIFPTGKKDIREFGPPEQVFPYNFWVLFNLNPILSFQGNEQRKHHSVTC